MHQVSLIQAFEIAISWHVFQRPAFVDKPVVSHEVQQSVCSHASADPLQRVHPLISECNQRNGKQRKNNSV
ncbi:hypothetical protein IV01_09195 [Pseudomonas syringae]|uniref:Uncharacterized protein n=1 Tax=Pseudomonas syringae TaxID=317 RepID=A0A085VM17_PSESX|nr:hypothetical protein IV01_09195 [Pseudomonas syringae]